MGVFISNYLSHNANHCSWGLNRHCLSYSTHTGQETGLCKHKRPRSHLYLLPILYQNYIPWNRELLLVVGSFPEAANLKQKRGCCILILFRLHMGLFLLVLDTVPQGTGLRKENLWPHRNTILSIFSFLFLSLCGFVYLLWTPTIFL